MKRYICSTITRLIPSMLVLGTSLLLDAFSSWPITPILGFSLLISFFCLRVGYEEEKTFMKALLITLFPMAGLPWTAAAIALLLFNTAERKLDRIIVKRRIGDGKGTL